MDKNRIQKFAVWARVELIEQVKLRAYWYGITEEKCGESDTTTVNGQAMTPAEQKKRAALAREIAAKGYPQVMEEAAYTWFNRFIALRFLEVNNYLPSHVRVFSDSEGRFKPEILSAALEVELPGLDKEKVEICIRDNRTEELYRYLLLTQCNALHDALPVMFEWVEDWSELLLPDHLLKEDGVLAELVNAIPDAWWKEFEIIGWLYQYYISERHDQVVNINKSVVNREDVPAATQLFTTDWVVRYMVDNSLGRYWIERHPESRLADKLEFFVRPKSGKIAYLDDPVKPQEISFLDPCMGSGHILLYAFDVLIDIYKECGYRERDAAAEILQHNLFGLDVDSSCSQKAYFALMAKARQYDRRFFERGIQPQVYYPNEQQDICEFGSLALVTSPGEKPEGVAVLDEDGRKKLMDWDFRRLLSQKYTIVCTNPPYLNKYNPKLKAYVTENFKDYSGDLFSVFMYRNLQLCKPGGYCGFMTPFVWMFIKTYEKLRRYILDNKAITTLVQMEYSAFEEATVPICSFVLQNQKATQPALCFRLSDFKGGMEVQRQKVLEAIKNPECGYFYEAQQDNFAKIPGVPVAYWVSEKFTEAFEKSVLIGDFSIISEGIKTGNNDLFLKLWFEIDATKFSFGMSNKNFKWYPHHKGGDFRKWYGNLEWVINWENNGLGIKRSTNSGLQGKNMYFREFIGWSKISSKGNPLRYYPANMLFDSGAPSISNSKMKECMALLNSKVGQYCLSVISPTLNLQVGDVKSVPFCLDADKNITEIVDRCIVISKEDWDSFETSWNFRRHPLI